MTTEQRPPGRIRQIDDGLCWVCHRHDAATNVPLISIESKHNRLEICPACLREALALVGGEDWTRDSDGRSNSSKRFLAIVSDVERLIRNSAHGIVGGQIESVARLIVAQLTHKHGMAPSEVLDEPSAGKERE